MIQTLIDGYFAQIKSDEELTTALEKHLCCGSYAKVGGGPIKDAVYQFLCDELGDDRYNVFNDLYENGYCRYADSQDLLEIGYYKPIDEMFGCYAGETLRKVNKKIDPKQAKSYTKLRTCDEVLKYYYPEKHIENSIKKGKQIMNENKDVLDRLSQK